MGDPSRPSTGSDASSPKTVYSLHGMPLATRKQRLAALLIDLTITALITFMLVGVGLGTDAGGPPPLAAAIAMALAFLTFYYILCWTAFSSTPGKMILGLKIVDHNGWPLGIAKSIARLFGYAISTTAVGLGFIWIFIDSFGRGWHDHVADTYVIYEGRGKARSRNMASDLFSDLASGPPTVRRDNPETRSGDNDSDRRPSSRKSTWPTE